MQPASGQGRALQSIHRNRTHGIAPTSCGQQLAGAIPCIFSGYKPFHKNPQNGIGSACPLCACGCKTTCLMRRSLLHAPTCIDMHGTDSRTWHHVARGTCRRCGEDSGRRDVGHGKKTLKAARRMCCACSVVQCSVWTGQGERQRTKRNQSSGFRT